MESAFRLLGLAKRWVWEPFFKCAWNRLFSLFRRVSRIPGRRPRRSLVGREEPRRRGEEPADVEAQVTGEEEAHLVDASDEFYTGYDSTWETEPTGTPPKRRKTNYGGCSYKFSRFEDATRDMQNYRHDYKNHSRAQNFGNQNNVLQDAMPNLEFYLGKTPSLPDGVYIQDFHTDWRGNYTDLENVHTYIQWLFPLQEPGVNYHAKTLTKQEIEEFLRSDKARDNLRKSYELMLDFYGTSLKDEKTGEVERAENWSERFHNLNRHTHNNLRITRILKCLGNLGYRHFQAPLVRFFLEETLVKGELPNVKDSALSYFLFAVLDKNERRKLLRFAYDHYEPKEEFVWCPKQIQRVWDKQNKVTYEEG